MKYLLFSVLLSCTIISDAQVGIGTLTPNTSAQLDLTSTTKGFLPPRMTYNQRNAIPNPVAGLIVWCTNCGTNGELQVYNGFGWIGMNAGPANPPAVTICDQIWPTINLDVTTYQNGDIIPQVTDQTQWNNLTTGAWCWYNNDSAAYAATYGKLYNWYAVNDSRGLAPLGWHIPHDLEWEDLVTCLGGASIAGGALKETGTAHWQSPNSGATNSSGFTARPGGQRSSGGFEVVGLFARFWSINEYDATNAYMRSLNHLGPDLGTGNSPKGWGFSIRCVKN